MQLLATKAEQGHAQAQIWADRLTRVQEMVHGTTGDGNNPIIRAHQEVAHKIASHAKDPVERDLGIIAAGQLALHYYVAAFGTLAAYPTRWVRPRRRASSSSAPTRRSSTTRNTRGSPGS